MDMRKLIQKEKTLLIWGRHLSKKQVPSLYIIVIV